MREKKLMDEAMEELEGAKIYIKCAMKYRVDHPAWAKKFYEMAQDELRHAEMLYGMVGSETAAHTSLETAYLDDQKDEYTECIGHIRAMIDVYREA